MFHLLFKIIYRKPFGKKTQNNKQGQKLYKQKKLI